MQGIKCSGIFLFFRILFGKQHDSPFLYEIAIAVKNSTMIYVLIVLALILLMPIEVVITKNDNRSDIDIYLTKIFNIRIDFDDFLRFLIGEKEEGVNKITLRSIDDAVKQFRKHSGSFAKIARMTDMRKLTVILKTKSNSIEADTWGFVGSWIVFGYTQNYAHRYFRRVENEFYNHQIAPRFAMNLESKLHMRFITFCALLYQIAMVARD